MPETQFRVRWPDQSVDSCYSPSLVVKKYFTPGQTYDLNEFVSLSRESLTVASERVKAAFGHHCSIAARQLAEIERKASTFEKLPDAKVVVEGFDDLPDKRA